MIKIDDLIVRDTESPVPNDGPRLHWPRGQRGDRAIRFGGDYNPEQWPAEVWTTDIALMRQAGINLVSVGIFSWAMLEPREGVYDFTRLDQIMELLAQARIDVDLGTPTAAPPAWFWRAYPQSHPVTRDGVRLAFGSRGMVAPTSPEYRRAAVGIADRLAKHYRGHPALAMWHVHNEYGAPVGEDYSDNAVPAFRHWLQQRYLGLDQLNAAWGHGVLGADLRRLGRDRPAATLSLDDQPGAAPGLRPVQQPGTVGLLPGRTGCVARPHP